MKERQFTATQRLETLAEDFASRIDYDWRALAGQCTQVVVFGSRAADLHTAFSDLDILLVVEHRLSVPLPGPLSGFDLVVRSENGAVPRRG